MYISHLILAPVGNLPERFDWGEEEAYAGRHQSKVREKLAADLVFGRAVYCALDVVRWIHEYF